MDWLTTIRALWERITGPKKAEVVVEKLPTLAPGDSLVLHMRPEWEETPEARAFFLAIARRVVGDDVTLVVMPWAMRPESGACCYVSKQVVVNNTIGGEAGPEIVAAAVRRATEGGM